MAISILCSKLILNALKPSVWVAPRQILFSSIKYFKTLGPEDMYMFSCIKGDNADSLPNRHAYEKFSDRQELELVERLISSKDTLDFDQLKSLCLDTNFKLTRIVRNRVSETTFDFDHWYRLAITLIKMDIRPRYLGPLLDHMSKQSETLITNERLLQMLLLTILCREHMNILINFETRISELLDEASFEETALICNAYFKTKTMMTNESIIKKVIRIVKQNISEIDFSKPGYNSIMKCLRYSGKIFSVSEELHSELVDMIKEVLGYSREKSIFKNTFNATQTIKLMETARIHDRKLLDDIIDTMFDNLADYRIKDIQYLLTSFSFFHHQGMDLEDSFKANLDNLCAMIVSGARKDNHMLPHHIVPLLRAMAVFKYYNGDLIDLANRLFDNKRTLQTLEKVIEADRTALLLYVSTRLEDCSLPFLQNRLHLVKRISARISRSPNDVGNAKRDSSIRRLRHQYPSNRPSMSDLALIQINLLAKTNELRDLSYRFDMQYLMPHENFVNLVISKNCSPPETFDPDTIMPQRIPANQRRCLVIFVRDFDYVDLEKGLLSGNKLHVGRLYEELGYHVFYINMKDRNVLDTARKIKKILDN